MSAALRDLPLFSAVDVAKMSAACQCLAANAGPLWFSKRIWAGIAGCSEHAVSARFSDLRKMGYQVDRRTVRRDGSGEVCRLHEYRILKPAGYAVGGAR